MYDKLVSLIIILISIFLLYFIIERNVSIEAFEINDYNINSSFEKTIIVPVELKYTTFNLKLESNNDTLYNQIIIENFQNILSRQPNEFELSYFKSRFITKEIDEEYFKMILFNLPEYSRNIKLSSNEIEPGLQQYTYKNKLSRLILGLYEKYVEPIMENKPILLPALRDIFIHLRFDMYMFIAALTSDGFVNLENAIINTDVLSNKKLYELFYGFIVIENVSDVANQLKREDLADGSSNIINGLNIDMNNVRKNTRKFKEDNNITNTIADAIQNQYGFDKNQCAKYFDHSEKSEKCEIKRFYNTKNKSHVPQVCNMLNQPKNNVAPLFENSKNLFQGADINTAYKNTQIGSIMPKFEFKEYTDVKTCD
jgi:hypothetical protein